MEHVARFSACEKSTASQHWASLDFAGGSDEMIAGSVLGNAIEQCWDCPCPGSQFAPGGTALSGPAVAPLPEFQFRQGRLEAAE
jgi:Rieske Fe-S protein